MIGGLSLPETSKTALEEAGPATGRTAQSAKRGVERAV